MSTSKPLHQRKCRACTGDTPILEGKELQEYYNNLQKGWELIDEHHLEKTFNFKDFKQALDFTYNIGQMSEEEGHHPNIHLSWGKVEVKIYTHIIDGLSENDFIWASKADRLYNS